MNKIVFFGGFLLRYNNKKRHFILFLFTIAICFGVYLFTACHSNNEEIPYVEYDESSYCGFSYELDDINETATIKKCHDLSGDIIIIDKITLSSKTYKITSIGDYAFFLCS